MIPIPGSETRCVACGRMVRWRAGPRGRLVAIDDELVPGGNVELVGEDGYLGVMPHPAVERARLHASACSHLWGN